MGGYKDSGIEIRGNVAYYNDNVHVLELGQIFTTHLIADKVIE